MTEPAVKISHPPDAFLRTVNKALRPLLRTPLAGPARKHLMVVSFNGRKSGRRYEIPVSAHRIDGDLYALASAPWTKNFRGGHTADILHDGKTTAMLGQIVEDRARVADLYHRCADAYGPKRAQRMMGLGFRDNRTPTVEEFAEAIDREGMVAIRFTRA